MKAKHSGLSESHMHKPCLSAAFAGNGGEETEGRGVCFLFYCHFSKFGTLRSHMQTSSFKTVHVLKWLNITEFIVKNAVFLYRAKPYLLFKPTTPNIMALS